MDTQCDRCGAELPEETKSVQVAFGEPGERYNLEFRRSFHLATGSSEIFDDGDSDWDPSFECDLCPECRDQFITMWEAFYGGQSNAT